MVKRDFAALLAGGEGDKRQIAALADLLERLTALDPDRCAAHVHKHRCRLGALWCLRQPKVAFQHAFVVYCQNTSLGDACATLSYPIISVYSYISQIMCGSNLNFSSHYRVGPIRG